MAETSKKNIESQQLEMFGDIGMAKSPAKKDPVSGNEIPKASTAEEVRDDIPARLSEGEFVLPADVVRYHGLEKLMNLRQEAKQGINTMDKMGQLGNADEATMPDDLPFDINDLEMQVGGFVSPTGTYQVATDIATAPSYFQNYAQSVAPFTPFVPSGETQIPPVAPVTKTTGPTFQTLIPTQGKKPVTKEYRNEAGQKLFIPFIDNKPIYPIPEGYTEYKEEKEVISEKDKKPAVTTQTTTVTGDDSSEDTSVRSTTQRGVGAGKILNTNFKTQAPNEVKKNLDQMRGGDRGLSVLAALENAKGRTGLAKAIEQVGYGAASILAPGAMSLPIIGAQLYQAGTYNPIEAFKQIGAPDTTALNNILNAYGGDFSGLTPEEIDQQGINRNEALSQAIYGKSISEVTKDLGVTPTFRRGKKPGDIDIETGYTFDEDGQAGGAYEVPSYASVADFTKAMGASTATGFVGSKATAKDVMRRNPPNSKAYQKAQSFLNYFKDDDKKPDDKKPDDRFFSPSDVGDKPPKQTQPDPIDYSPPSTVGDPSYSTPSEVASASSFGDEPGDSSPSGDSGDMGFSTAVGGFIKKKKPKVKKMKQGGLASR